MHKNGLTTTVIKLDKHRGNHIMCRDQHYIFHYITTTTITYFHDFTYCLAL